MKQGIKIEIGNNIKTSYKKGMKPLIEYLEDKIFKGVTSTISQVKRLMAKEVIQCHRTVLVQPSIIDNILILDFYNTDDEYMFTHTLVIVRP